MGTDEVSVDADPSAPPRRVEGNVIPIQGRTPRKRRPIGKTEITIGDGE